jgi:glycosyltransferase involved in cell wall biosynthesis
MKFSVTIITINKNNKEGLVKTINSVLTQVDASFEYVIIDGKSDDGSVEILNEY